MKHITAIACILVLALCMSAAFADIDRGEARVKPWSGYWWSMNRGELANGYDGRPAPLEKYDFAAGNQNNEATQWYLDNHYDPDAPGWHGYCHAWSSASIIDREPGATQYGEVAFRIGDNKGLLTACHFSDPASFWGDRYGDGRGSDDPDDIDPGLLWQVLQVHVRDNGLPLVMDMNPGDEVWNHPVHSYEVDYRPSGEGNRYNCRMTLTGVDDAVGPDYVGTQERRWELRFTVDISNGNVVVGSGRWVGSSRDSHPDFAWFPLQQATPNPHLRYALCQQIAQLPAGASQPGTLPPTQPVTQPVTQPEQTPLPPGGQQLQTVQNPDAPFTAEIWVDSKDATYAVGENVTIMFRVSRDAHVLVLDLGTSGKLTRLFPNQFHKDNRVVAGQVYSIPAKGDPFAYTTGKPAGTEMLKIIASTKQFDDQIGPQEQGQVFQGAQKGVNDYSRDLNMVMQQLPEDGWTDGWCVFRIVEKK